MPVVRDPDSFIYFRENEGRYLAGGFQPWAKPAFVSGPMPSSMKVTMLALVIGKLELQNYYFCLVTLVKLQKCHLSGSEVPLDSRQPFVNAFVKL